MALPIPLLVLLFGPVAGAVFATLRATAASDADTDDREETARNRREAEALARRREKAARKNKRRAAILKDATAALSELAGRHKDLGCSPVARLTEAMLEEAVSACHDGTTEGSRKARDMLMRVNPARGSTGRLRDIRKISQRVGTLNALSRTVSEHVATVELGWDLTATERRIRRQLQILATSGQAGKQNARIAEAVNRYLRLAAIDAHSPTRIVACGLLCAGKSSLLNALSDLHTPEYFVTGGGRTTRDSRKLLTVLAQERCLLIDTPGLDAGMGSEADDGKAAAEIDTADHLLFVHALSTGALHGAEVEFLNALAAERSSDGSLPELTVVLTHAESCQKEAERLSSAVLSMVEEATGWPAIIFQTSTPAYAKGVTEHKQGLIDFSGIPTLRLHLGEVLHRHESLVEGRKRRRALVAAQVSSVIESCASGLGRRRSQLADERRVEEQRFDEAFRQILGNIRKRLKAS